MKPAVHLTGRRVVLLLSLVSLVGCLQSPADDDDRLEHVIPAHKPAGYVEATNQLALRGHRYFSGQLDAASRTELREILEWLPELAADTDLTRSQWDRVQEIRRELSRLVAPEQPDKSWAVTWADRMAELKSLVPDADSWIQPDSAMESGTVQPGE